MKRLRPYDLPQEWSNALREAIEEAVVGRSFRAVADEIGIPEKTLQQIARNGTRPSLDLAQKIGQHFGFRFSRTARRRRIVN